MFASLISALGLLSFVHAATIDYFAVSRPLAGLVAGFVNGGLHRNGFTNLSDKNYQLSALGVVISSQFSESNFDEEKLQRLHRRQDDATPTSPGNFDSRPTPAPTGDPSPSTTVHITSTGDFALLLPEMISDAESDGVAYCASSSSGCTRTFPSALITGAAVSQADDGSWIQITGCLDSSKFPFAQDDDGGQFDIRFPNGAQCSFGGYGASFIEQYAIYTLFSF
ncbi:hypothetical protein SERLA73DRAFT_69906 [Serpula lacrymans var. lacrymans S7.3]|uniref:Uncharacterized protein n=1 Tax=Serpula lacrymans var. lacrymans (strain S7.3) TaxID=936435 RepID=F8PJJ4_SERL3|nr:hypothetical protein SERLA73DRAFT_69906 [Serpula lacrymans var. lacrymans S7.3]